MPVFISHSKTGESEQTALQNLLDFLKAKEVSVWLDEERMQAGHSLNLQLQAGIKACDVCIFIATEKSLGSPWCGAEVGAFWGAGKSVIVYRAEAGMNHEHLPDHLQVDFSSNSLRMVVDSAKQELDKARQHREQPLVRDMTLAVFADLIRNCLGIAIGPRAYEESLTSRLIFLQGAMTVMARELPSRFLEASVYESLGGLLELTEVESTARLVFEYAFEWSIGDLIWEGFACSLENDGYGNPTVLRQSLLLLLQDGICKAAVVASQITQTGESWKIGEKCWVKGNNDPGRVGIIRLEQETDA